MISLFFAPQGTDPPSPGERSYELQTSAPHPHITVDSDRCLVKVAAFSLTPLKEKERGVFSEERVAVISFSGIITATGKEFEFKSNLRSGQAVMGLYFPSGNYNNGFKCASGSFGERTELIAEFVSVKYNQIVEKPGFLHPTQAAVIPRIGVMSFVVLKHFANVYYEKANHLGDNHTRCLVLSSSLHLESVIISQLAKSFGMSVTLICIGNLSKDKIDDMKRQGIDNVVKVSSSNEVEAMVEKVLEDEDRYFEMFDVCIDFIHTPDPEFVKIRSLAKNLLRPGAKWIYKTNSNLALNSVVNGFNTVLGSADICKMTTQTYAVNYDTFLTKFDARTRHRYLKAVARLANGRNLKVSPLVLTKPGVQDHSRIYSDGVFFPFTSKAVNQVLHSGCIDGINDPSKMVGVFIVDEGQCGPVFAGGSTRFQGTNARRQNVTHQVHLGLTEESHSSIAMKRMKSVRDSVRQKMKHISVRRKSKKDIAKEESFNDDYYDYD